MAEKRDYYEVLGIDKSADNETIKKAYRNLAKKYHPDMNPGDKEAEVKFKEVNEAYDVLSDSDKKAKYDQFGHAAFDQTSGFGGGGFGGFGGMDFDISDIFSSFFGGGASQQRRNGPTKGESVEANVTLTFEEAAFGCKKDVSYQRIEKCSECAGSGAAKGTQAKTCSTCGGSGQVTVQQRTAFGMMRTQRPCDKCRGSGKIIEKPCQSCRGNGYIKNTKKLEVSIPAGIDNGQRVVIRGQGCDGRNGGPSGDLIINVFVKSHSVFKRDGNDIYCEVPITFVDAALGAEIDVPTLEGSEKYTIKEGTQTGTIFTIRGKGMPDMYTKRRGDIRFMVVVETPTNLSSEQKELLRQFSGQQNSKNYQKREKFFKMFGK